MVEYKLNKLVAAVQGVMGSDFRVSLVSSDLNRDGTYFQLEAVDLATTDRSARSHEYPLAHVGPLSDLIGLCANTLKKQLQMEFFSDAPL